MAAMECRAVGIATQDLAAGVDFLKQLQEEEKLTWLSMNLVGKEDKKPVFAGSLLIKEGGLTIAVAGLTDEQALTGRDSAYTILPWQTVVANTISSISSKADMVILLSSYPDPVNRKIAESVSGIDLILASGHSPGNRIPLTIKETLLARVAVQGKYLGMMRINWTEAKKWADNSPGQLKSKQNELDRINWRIGRLQRRIKGAELAADPNYQQLLIDKKQVQQAITDLKNSKTKPADSLSTFSNSFIPLKAAMPEDRQIQKIIDQTTQEVNTLNKKRVHKPDRHSSLKSMTGWQKCRQCHPEQTRFWQTTAHARALQTLEADNQQFNEACLLCHVTLPFYESQRVTAEQLLLSLPGSLQTVGCESCHGSGLAHSSAPETVSPLLPKEKTCLSCHTPDRDDNFIFAEKVGKIRCPRG
jgi:nitrate/TMAO reductase-like tetraheme cytochrome c subunit